MAFTLMVNLLPALDADQLVVMKMFIDSQTPNPSEAERARVFEKEVDRLVDKHLQKNQKTKA